MHDNSIVGFNTSDGDKQSSMTPEVDVVLIINKLAAPLVIMEGAFSLPTHFDCVVSPFEVAASQCKFFLSGVFPFHLFEVASVRVSIVFALRKMDFRELLPSKDHGLK